MKKVVVLHLVEDLKVGGLERIIAGIAEKADKQKFMVKVWCLARGGKIYEELKSKGFDVRILSMKSHRDIGFFIKFFSMLKNEKIQVIHTHGRTAATIGRFCGVCARIPVIISHMHTTCWNFSIKHNMVDRLLSFFTDRIICCSKAVYDSVVNSQGISPKKVVVIYNGVDEEKFCPVREGAK